MIPRWHVEGLLKGLREIRRTVSDYRDNFLVAHWDRRLSCRLLRTRLPPPNRRQEIRRFSSGDQLMNVDLIRVLVAVVAVGISLAGLMLASWRGLRHEMRDMRRKYGTCGADRLPYRRTPGTHGARRRTAEGIARISSSAGTCPTRRGNFLVAHWEERLSCRPLGGATFLSHWEEATFLSPAPDSRRVR